MDEREGRAVLRARFEAAGLTIVEDHPLDVDGHAVVADGFDAAATSVAVPVTAAMSAVSAAPTAVIRPKRLGLRRGVVMLSFPLGQCFAKRSLCTVSSAI
jgi:hypothetical protein